jgi:mono/diheme cytochrome c family protein
MSVKQIAVGATFALAMAASAAVAAGEKPSADMVARGKDLVTHGMCHDCHTPKTFTDGKMGFDYTKELSGHQAGSPLPPVDKRALQPGYWILGAGDLTAWVGPWGVSYAANLTPDDQTGIGLWTEDVFIKAMRTGKHMGDGRPILPPMPYEFVGHMKDEDLKSIFAYMRSLKPIKNVVPQPVAPADVK